jgi:hypothetical protein
MCHEVLTNQTAMTNAPAVVDRILPVTLASTLVDGATTTGDAYQCACNDCYNIKCPNPSASTILCKYCVRLALSDLLDLFLLLERSESGICQSRVRVVIQICDVMTPSLSAASNSPTLDYVSEDEGCRTARINILKRLHVRGATQSLVCIRFLTRSWYGHHPTRNRENRSNLRHKTEDLVSTKGTKRRRRVVGTDSSQRSLRRGKCLLASSVSRLMPSQLEQVWVSS